LDDCMHFGTLPFSTMARIAFVASAMMNSLVDMGIVKQDEIQSFMQTIHTPLSTLREDFVKFTDKKMNQKDFFSKYGHLRPGTYDITALRYDKHNTFSSNLKFITKPPKSNITLNDDLIKSTFNSHDIYFDEIKFSEFVSQSLKYREELKFNFTKNLSDALEFLNQAGIQLGFSKEDLSHLNISQILNSYSEIKKDDLIEKLKQMIMSEKSLSLIQDKIILPSLIFNTNDLEIIRYFDAKPNFISEKSFTGEIVNLSINPNQSITNKIVYIENADPGYDWIFTENPIGLITKYGGVASHMAIRCAEINLPAAIGIGDKIFEKISDAKKILFDCKNKKIIVLETSNFDEESEIEKTLKSIGYVK
jgi:phosphohistidine swiveling domain-containing protein